MVILEEFNLPRSRCPCLYMLEPLAALNGIHTTTSQCAKGSEQKRCWLSVEEMWESTVRALQAYGRPMNSVTLFKYLGQVMMASDYAWPEVVVNLRK